MKKKPKKVPETVRASIWFVNPEKVDWDQNKKLIITSILSRGSLKAVRWAFRFYGEETIWDIVAHPGRGLWFPKSLHFWSQFFNLSIDPKIYQKALFCLDPKGPSG